MKKFIRLGIVIALAGVFAACSPEVGSKEWCADMKKKAKGDWSANEAADIAKNFI